jgi:hypothetical protein
MALSLSCRCGAAFEVEDTFAGQAIACPDCGGSLKVPLLRPPQRRTSGYALASVVLALVGAFTIIGTAVAAALGVAALVSIARHRDRLSGAGYAVLGIVLGSGLTLVTGFAFSRGEVFDRIRERVTAGQVETNRPMEVVLPEKGYSITRPTRAWGVATADYAQEMGAGDNLLLANVARNAFLEVMPDDAGRDTLDQYRERFLDNYRNGRPPGPRRIEDLMAFTEFRLRDTKRLPPQDGAERAEVLFDVKRVGQLWTYRVRFVKPKAGTRVYVLIAWTQRSRLEQMEPEVQQAMDSFRLLANR